MEESMNDRDERALEALLCLAHLEDLLRDMPSLSGPEPELDAADQAALDALGPDLVQRLFRGDLGTRPAT